MTKSRLLLSIATASLALAACAAPSTAGFAQSSEGASVQIPEPLPVGTCINMGNSLEPEQEGSWGGEPIIAADFARIADVGFDSVRIPVRWHNKSMETAPYAIDPDWMARVVEVVDMALAEDLNVILNSHHFDPIYSDPAGTAQWHGGVWDQIARQFADYPEDRLWFELENEPHDQLTHENLLDTLEPALLAVRASNPTRAVIIGGENWSGVDSLASLPLPGDANIHPTFHYYDPFQFTHQGASWTAPDMPEPGRQFGGAEDLAQLQRDVAKVQAFIERTGRVPFMGETGAYDLHISTPERAAYHRAVREAFAPTGIGICTWAYANTFPFWDRESGNWLPGMRAAMGLPED